MTMQTGCIAQGRSASSARFRFALRTLKSRACENLHVSNSLPPQSAFATYVVTTHPGAEGFLQEELAEILPGVETLARRGSVEFRAQPGAMHRVNLWTRSGIRVLEKVREVPLDPDSAAGDTIYEAIREAMPWGDWLDSPNKSFSIDVGVAALALPRISTSRLSHSHCALRSFTRHEYGTIRILATRSSFSGGAGTQFVTPSDRPRGTGRCLRRKVASPNFL